MHSLLKTSLLMLAAICVLEAAPNSPSAADGNPTPGTLKFTVDHHQLGKENEFEFMTILGGDLMAWKQCKHTKISTNPLEMKLEFSVNWAESECVEKLSDIEKVQIDFKFKHREVEKVGFYNYEPMLKHLYAGGEVKITLHHDQKKSELKYVKYPTGETVPLPGIMTFHVQQIDISNEKFRLARLYTPVGIRSPISNDKEAKKFSVDWSKCGVVEAADLKHIIIDIQNDLILKPKGHFDPVHSAVLPKEELEKFFAGGDAKIVIEPAHKTDVIYLNGPSESGASASSGSQVEIASGSQ